ncbi:MAG: helix-turn-helix domain-containing protein, partial [Acidimicrobiales bacterium]
PRPLADPTSILAQVSAMGRSGPTDWPVWSLVREARHRAGLSQAQLAARAGTSQPAIARYEKARTMPDLATLHRIVEACGLELRYQLSAPDPRRRPASRGSPASGGPRRPPCGLTAFLALGLDEHRQHDDPPARARRGGQDHHQLPVWTERLRLRLKKRF